MIEPSGDATAAPRDMEDPDECREQQSGRGRDECADPRAALRG
jgi:hypothetical protein